MKEKVASITKTFTDYAGNVRHFTIAAVSVMLEKPTLAVEIENSDFDWELSAEPVFKALHLGISAQRPGEEFNAELGVKIAVGKAKKEKSCFASLYSTDLGLINTKMVEALLEQESEFFINNPGKYLKGYNKDKEKYLSSKQL